MPFQIHHFLNFFSKACILKSFKKQNFKDKFNYEFIYPTTHDAVLNICFNKKANVIDLVSDPKSDITLENIENECSA